ncbi:MAG TPA: hypothetical protein VHS30_07175 [Streptosporangiaceae bacterium]|nr:hypothetical protein [Streptosporangiaceae bacterium]
MNGSAATSASRTCRWLASGWSRGRARRSGSTAISRERVASSGARRDPSSRSAFPPSRITKSGSSRDWVSRNRTPGCAVRKLRARSGTSQVPSDCWKASATVPVSGSMSWLTAAMPSSRLCSSASRCGLNTAPACVIRSVRPERRSSGVPICASSRARARETPDWVTDSSSLTSVSVVPSVTCWSQRSASVSISMTLAHGLVVNKSLDA